MVVSTGAFEVDDIVDEGGGTPKKYLGYNTFFYMWRDTHVSVGAVGKSSARVVNIGNIRNAVYVNLSSGSIPSCSPSSRGCPTRPWLLLTVQPSISEIGGFLLPRTRSLGNRSCAVERYDMYPRNWEFEIGVRAYVSELT